MKDLVIFGCGGVGSFMVHAINEINRTSPVWNILGFIDDDKELYGTKLNGYRVLGTSEWIRDNAAVTVALAIAEPRIKSSVVEKLKSIGCNHFATIVHPHTWMADSVTVGEGSIIYPGTAINVNTVIGKFATINMNCAIGHDVKIKDYSFLAPNVGIGGNTVISEGCTVGMGASVLQHIVIGERAIVGAGAVVVDNVEPDQTVVGVPAKPVNNF